MSAFISSIITAGRNFKTTNPSPRQKFPPFQPAKTNFKKKLANRRKNYLPTILITLIIWSLLACLIYFFSPEDQFALPAFFLLAILSLFLSFSLLLAHSRRGFLLALAATIFLILRYFGQGHILNAVILFSLAIVTEILFSR